MSLYAEYLQERTGDEILELASGFATYRFINNGTSVYIIDIYVEPEHRKTGLASALADQICRWAKDRGCSELLGTVAMGKPWTTDNTKVMLGYGMAIHSATPEAIIFRKEL
jgi:GNAT superfamily N-acetyltransferase